MALSLGYKKLKQTVIQKSYSPIAHENDSIENWNYQQAKKQFFETGTKMHNIWVENYLTSQQTQVDEIEEV